MYRVTKRLYIAKNNDASTPFTASSPLLAQPQLRPGRGSRRTPSSASLRHSRGSKHSPKGIPPKKILSSGAKQKHIADFGQTKHIYRIYIYIWWLINILSSWNGRSSRKKSFADLSRPLREAWSYNHV